ncbi:terminase large subunit [Xanthomonas phage SB3]|uniref:Terminase large subunit n=1 Tax=Xanthomonas phage SB3 TaxID=3117472 RepID=A0ABZ2GUJ4_9CAUD
MMAADNAGAAHVRLAQLRLLQQHYSSFLVFMKAMMLYLGFKPTWLQYDIAAFLQFGPNDMMIQAQRGEAKSTITALYAIWMLIHDPKHRVVVACSNGKRAKEMATLITRLILTCPQLSCLKPSKIDGDRTATDSFDIHHSLKGPDKSPSVSCLGISGGLTGARADLLISDDIEIPQNSDTAGKRDWLMQLAQEFASVCTGRKDDSGEWVARPRIIYLGTPQTSESMYNTLPGRGFLVRIWPGRYPNPSEVEAYGGLLAPSILKRLEENPALAFGGGVLGDQGQPTDPDLKGEEELQAVQNKNGRPYFNLQYMLDTRLADEQRYPLKTEHIVVLTGAPTKRVPLTIARGFAASHMRDFTSAGIAFRMTSPHEVSTETAELTGVHMFVDPAGGGANGDESAYAVTGFLNGNVYVLDVGGVPGGYSHASMDALAMVAEKWQPNGVTVEKNMGYGAFTEVWLPILRKRYAGLVESVWESGKKETRIIQTLEPIMGRGSLVMFDTLVEQDDVQTAKYAHTGIRQTYSLFHQITKLMAVSKCLKHDDRLDALAGSVAHWVKHMAVDQKKVIENNEKKEHQKWINNPLGHPVGRRPRKGSVLNKYM